MRLSGIKTLPALASVGVLAAALMVGTSPGFAQGRGGGGGGGGHGSGMEQTDHGAGGQGGQRGGQGTGRGGASSGQSLRDIFHDMELGATAAQPSATSEEHGSSTQRGGSASSTRGKGGAASSTRGKGGSASTTTRGNKGTAAQGKGKSTTPAAAEEEELRSSGLGRDAGQGREARSRQHRLRHQEGRYLRRHVRHPARRERRADSHATG